MFFLLPGTNNKVPAKLLNKGSFLEGWFP